MEGQGGEELIEVPPPETDQEHDQPPADAEQEGIAPEVEYDNQLELATEWPALPNPYQWDEDELNDATLLFRTSAPCIPTLEHGENHCHALCNLTQPWSQP